MNYKYILWDWNGTLLDDVEVCVNVMNKLLLKRNLPTINKKYYRDIFNFPVIEYYKKLGFNFSREPFENVSVEFINEYQNEVRKANLVKDAKEVIKYFYKRGFKQIILSASYINNLENQIKNFEIHYFFEELLGLNHIHATSKIGIGTEWLKKSNISPKDILLIGDSIHDYETAKELRCDVILVSYGHQSKERLLECNVRVLNSINELIDIFSNDKSI